MKDIIVVVLIPVVETREEVYARMWKAFYTGQIGCTEWYEYCEGILETIMDENVAILKRMKEN